MAKKTYSILIFIFFISVMIFSGHGQAIKEYEQMTKEYFNATIYLTTEVDQRSTINALKTIADDDQLTIAKIIPQHDGTTDIFVYSHENKYMRDFLAAYGYLDLEDISFNSSIEINQTFYNKGIYLRPFEELENIGLEGKYAVHIGESLTIKNLTEEINDQYLNMLRVYPNKNLKNTFTSSVDNLKYVLGVVLIIILFATLLTSFLYDIKSRRREIAIKSVFGYGTRAIFSDVFLHKAIKPMLGAIIVAQLITITFFIWNKNIRTAETLKLFMWNSLRFAVFFMLVFMAVFSVFLLFYTARKSQKIQLISYLKGKDTSRNILSTLVKIGSTTLILISFGVALVSLNFLSDKKEAINHWDTTTDDYSLNIYIPEFLYQNQQWQGAFEQTHRAVWKYLNDKDGIMFSKRTEKVNSIPIFINHKEKNIPFIYINENYLKENVIIDDKNNRIFSIEDENDNVITVLVPLQYQSYEQELKQSIHELHVFDKYISEDIINERMAGKGNTVRLSKENLDNPEITEKFIYIEDNQRMFTYAAGKNFVIDGIYALVNENNMGLNVYTPSLPNIYVKTDHIRELSEETRTFFHEMGFGAVDTDFTSVYQQNAEDIRYFKNMMMFILMIFLLGFVFWVFSLLFYLKVYFMKNKKGIAIKNFLGYGFFYRNKMAFFGLLVQDIFVILCGLQFGLMVESTIIGAEIVVSIVMISLFALCFDFLISTLVLKGHESKFLAETLKGE